MKFPAGTFIEIDDGAGGRRVSMVGKDGVTFIDSMDVNAATPIVIHTVMHPEPLGTVMEFAAANDLVPVMQLFISYHRERINSDFEGDPLLMMRLLWHFRRLGGTKSTPSLISKAIDAAKKEKESVRKLHAHVAAALSVEHN